MAELTGLHQTTEAVSLSLQALLECLPLAPTTPLMPLTDAEWFVSAPSSGFLAPAAAEWFASASGLGLLAPHSKLPCSALPDVYNGDCKAGEHFLQSCITYIQLSSEAFILDALKIAWVLSYMKAMDLVLCYQEHSEQAAFAITSLGKRDMILGFTWLCEHNPDIDWTKGEVKMSHSHVTKKPVKSREPNPPSLAFPHREALYEDVQGAGCESPEEEEGEGEWTCTPDAESPDETIEVGDQIYATTLYPPLTVAEIWASQMTSQCLAEAFAANSQPKPFHSTVSNHLHDFEDLF
ncbi:hypothetical protein E4T56_gene18558 [Termitomyces sp. T112]|nr:hypothetical protein E4T56_gene18558 [Termitomyces sp. T112]